MSQICTKAEIGENVSICPTSIIFDNVVIGENSRIDSFCKIGVPSSSDSRKPLVIGPSSHIRSHSVFYDNSVFKKNLVTGHHVLVRDKIKAGKFFQIGSYTELEGESEFGDYVKLHSKVHISLKSKIGHFSWLFPRVQFSTDPLPPSFIELPISVGDMSVIAIGSLILPGVSIGDGTFISAGSVVKENVPDTHCVSGNPAKYFTRIDRLINFQYKIRHPWPYHFRNKYPKESYRHMDQIVKKIEAIIKGKKNENSLFRSQSTTQDYKKRS